VTRASRKTAKVAVVAMRSPRKCPVCGQPAVRRYYPFDSKRCADVDLGRWLSGNYVIPGANEAAAKDEDNGEET
jgi:endogenous inhibitor of DNA gyrase (YacG/DUF329 family)